MAVRAIQTALQLIYPPRCTLCGTQVESDFGLCGPCWRETPFISGLCCNFCGGPLPGEDRGTEEVCDDCLKTARPWGMGRAALIYRDNARKLILALKHGDRHDIVRPAALWMARAAVPLVQEGMIIAPVPLHWSRMLRRRFNQAALLGQAVCGHVGGRCIPDLLIRRKRTLSLDGMSYDGRFETLQEAIVPNPRFRQQIVGKTVLLIDDVMTSGATLSAATQACYSADAENVRILVLARVARDA